MGYLFGTMSLVAHGTFFRGYDNVYLEAEFQKRRKQANQHYGVPDYTATLLEDLKTSRERIKSWTHEYPDRIKLDRQRIERLKSHLDWYGVPVSSAPEDFRVLTPEDHKPKPGGLHFPGTNYLGPGTSDLTANVKGVADSVARKHDIAYNQAKSNEDVRAADRAAIKEFIESASSDPVRGYVGAAGIGLKYAAESVIGVQYGGGENKNKKTVGSYSKSDLELAIKDKKAHSATYMDTPPNSAEKRPSNANPGGTVPRRPRLDSAEPGPSDVEPVATGAADADNVEMAETAAGGAATTFGTAGDNQGPVLIGQGHVPSTERIYTKKFQLETMGFNPVTVDAANLWPGLYTAPTRQNAAKALSTSIAGIDPNVLSWYMSAAEFDDLSKFSIADSCKMTIRPLGYRIPFATNQSISENANSSATLVQIAYGQGLNHKFDGSLCTLTSVATNPALPTQVNYKGLDIQNLLYSGDWASCLGLAPFYNQYYVLNKFATPENKDPSSPFLMKALTIVNIADVRGEVVAGIDYQFKCAPLKWHNTFQDSSSLYHPGRSNYYPVSSNKDVATLPPNTLIPLRDYTKDAGHLFLDLEIFADNTLTVSHQIEKCNYMSWRPDRPFSSIMPPHLNFGCMPLRSDVPSATGAGTVSCLPVTVIWELSTELLVREIHEFPFSDMACPWTNHLLLQTPRGFGADMLTTNIDIPYYQGGSAARLYPYGKTGATHNRLKPTGKSDEATFSALTGNSKNNAAEQANQEEEEAPPANGAIPKRRRP